MFLLRNIRSRSRIYKKGYKQKVTMGNNLRAAINRINCVTAYIN